MRMFLTRVAVLAAVLPVAGPVLAEPLTGETLRITFAGKTIHLSAPFGSLPIRYSVSGSMVAQSKAMGLFAGVSRDEGSWRIAGDQFCQRWQVWLKGREQCFSVSRDGATLKWVSDDGMRGTARAAGP